MDALVSEVKRLASTADEEGRIKLLDALQDLRASIETPHDTFLRLAFGVSSQQHDLSFYLLALGND